MAKDPGAHALHRLYVAQANYEMACEAKATTRALLDRAIVKGSQAGLTNAEIGRAVGSTGQRVGQIILAAE